MLMEKGIREGLVAYSFLNFVCSWKAYYIIDVEKSTCSGTRFCTLETITAFYMVLLDDIYKKCNDSLRYLLYGQLRSISRAPSSVRDE